MLKADTENVTVVMKKESTTACPWRCWKVHNHIDGYEATERAHYKQKADKLVTLVRNGHFVDEDTA